MKKKGENKLKKRIRIGREKKYTLERKRKKVEAENGEDREDNNTSRKKKKLNLKRRECMRCEKKERSSDGLTT